ncbi:MAG: hypothetical protein WC569_05105 [Candidatus Omnitrophota bacterium]
MRRIAILLVAIIFTIGFMAVNGDFVFAKNGDKKTEEKKAEAKTPEPKVICKFKNKEDMGEFEKLYVAKQATFGRMGVLQAYFSMEQNNLQQIDKQMEEKFKLKMDPSKMYDLNRDNMEIREIGAVPQQPAQ